MPDLLVVVPSRGRPASAVRLLDAWDATGAWADADLLLAVDADDPAVAGYRPLAARGARLREFETWQPMVAKLNVCAVAAAGGYFAVGFMGDDHVPVTAGWAGRYLEVLRGLGSGMVWGDDLHRGPDLPTQWAVTSDIVRVLGRMVPAPVEHQFCDRAVLDVAEAAGCARYLPDVVVEHLHYSTGKAPKDAGYERVNSMERWRDDWAGYKRWRSGQFPADVAAVRRLWGERSAGG
jgi:hypothetical protein